MTKKRILFLGGSYSQLPVIAYAKQKDLHVITVDYLPENPGHRISDEYHNISTVDKEKVLDLARQLKIDAISAYASDPAAPTAAYVCDHLGLVGSPYQAVQTLSDKSMFRKFLHENNFNCPWYISGNSPDELLAEYKGGKAVLKPVDSSGSKGVKIIENKQDILANFDLAKQFSRVGKVILEQHIQRKGPQIHGEGFVHKGDLIFLHLGDQYFSETNPVVPVSTIVPSVYHQDVIPEVSRIVKAILKKTGFMTGGINVEFIRDHEDNLIPVEIGARSGGNYMPQLMMHATGFDLVKANVNLLIDEPLTDANDFVRKGHFAQLILHSRHDGYFEALNIPGTLRNNIVEQSIFFKNGDWVRYYRNSKDVTGVMILALKSEAEMQLYRDSLAGRDWVITR